MDNKKLISLLVICFFIFTILIPASSQDDDGWRKGRITKIMKGSIEINGKIYRVSKDVEIKDIYGEGLEPDLMVLKAVDEIRFKVLNGEIIKIRISALRE